MASKLNDICSYAKGKTAVAGLTAQNYISTENMLPNKGGITTATNLPSVDQTQAYRKNDVLVSNIRPYFKKIWHAEYDGGCSNDVLVFRAAEGVDPIFLYYVLADDTFFNYATATSKGTKMPRGDKSAIMEYGVPTLDIEVQRKIGALLRSIDQKIAINSKINDNLQQQAAAIYKSWFVDFSSADKVEMVDSEIGKIPRGWRVYRLSEFLPVITGKKNANVSSDTGEYPFFSCSQDFSWTDDYSFEGHAILVAGNGDFNVKWYKGKFEAYQRTYVLIPHEERYTSWLYYAVKYNLARITSAARGSVIKFITKGNLEDFAFAAPSDLCSCEIIDTFAAINRKIDCLTQENYRLASIRDTLLPRLMSGEIDVSDISI